MVKRTVAAFLMLQLGAIGCQSRVNPNPDVHKVPDINDQTDFAVLATLTGFENCTTDWSCKPWEPIPSIARVSQERAWYGTMPGALFWVPEGDAFDVEAINWWSRGRPVKLLLIGNNGPQPGWTAPVQEDIYRAWPACGRSTSEQLAWGGYGLVAIWDEEHGTVFNVRDLHAHYVQYGPAERDSEGRRMPDEFGSPDQDHLGDAAHEGYVRYQYDWERALQEAASKDVERSLGSFRYGTCADYSEN